MICVVFSRRSGRGGSPAPPALALPTLAPPTLGPRGGVQAPATKFRHVFVVKLKFFQEKYSGSETIFLECFAGPKRIIALMANRKVAGHTLDHQSLEVIHTVSGP